MWFGCFPGETFEKVVKLLEQWHYWTSNDHCRKFNHRQIFSYCQLPLEFPHRVISAFFSHRPSNQLWLRRLFLLHVQVKCVSHLCCSERGKCVGGIGNAREFIELIRLAKKIKVNLVWWKKIIALLVFSFRKTARQEEKRFLWLVSK